MKLSPEASAALDRLRSPDEWPTMRAAIDSMVSQCRGDKDENT